MLDQNDSITLMTIELDESLQRCGRLVQENHLLRCENKTLRELAAGETKIARAFGGMVLRLTAQLSQAHASLSALTMGNTSAPRSLSDN